MVILIRCTRQIYAVNHDPQHIREVGILHSPRTLPIQENAFWLQEWAERVPEGDARYPRTIPVDFCLSLYRRHHNLLSNI